MTLHINYTNININFFKFFYIYINKFCQIYHLNHLYQKVLKKTKKISLLRSPHIHKKTWRTYQFQNTKHNIIIYNINLNKFNKLNSLCQKFNKHSIIKLNLK